MCILKPKIKSTGLIIFVTFFIFFSTLQVKCVEKFDTSSNVSNYFSGSLLLKDNQYKKSYKFLKKLEGLEKNHNNYASKYLFSLVNLNKFNEAFNYAKNLEKKGLNSFESDLIIGIYYLNKEKKKQAKKYFLKLKNEKTNFILNDFISNSLYNWSNYSDYNLKQAQDRSGGKYGNKGIEAAIAAIKMSKIRKEENK